MISSNLVVAEVDHAFGQNHRGYVERDAQDIGLEGTDTDNRRHVGLDTKFSGIRRI